MKLEQQVVSLELAKKLKSLGCKQESLWWWYQQLGGIVCDTEVRGQWILRPNSEINQGLGEYISAYTVAELGNLLPAGFMTKKWVDSNKWICWGWEDTFEETADPRGTYQQEADTEANVKAKMLIYLLENKLIQEID